MARLRSRVARCRGTCRRRPWSPTLIGTWTTGAVHLRRLSRGTTVTVVEIMGLEPTTPCLQSQIGGGRHLRSWGSGAGRGRRGVVRGCPLGTDHDRCEWHGSGTARGQPWYACRCWVHLDYRVRAVRGNHGCMGKPLQTARQLFPMPSGRGRMGRWLRRPASMPAELGSSRLGAREDLLAAFLGVRD
jgi:hypothetical protein